MGCGASAAQPPSRQTDETYVQVSPGAGDFKKPKAVRAPPSPAKVQGDKKAPGVAVGSPGHRGSIVGQLSRPVGPLSKETRRGSFLTYTEGTSEVPDAIELVDPYEETIAPSAADPRRLGKKRGSIVAQFEVFQVAQMKANSHVVLPEASAPMGASTEAATMASDGATGGEPAPAASSAEPAPAPAEDGFETMSTNEGCESNGDGNSEIPQLPDKPRRQTKFFDSAGPDAGLEDVIRRHTSGQSFSSIAHTSSKSVATDLSSFKTSFNVSEELTSALRGGAKEAHLCESLETVIGTYTCRGMENSKLKPNQDYACYSQPFAGIGGTALFVVCDGHGRHGDDVSQEVLNSLIFELEEQAEGMLHEPGHTIATSFVAVNDHLHAMSMEEELQVDARDSGACAVLAFLSGAYTGGSLSPRPLRSIDLALLTRLPPSPVPPSPTGSQLWIGGVGDCRAILGTSDVNGGIITQPLSVDHAVDLPAERTRMEAAGGHIREGFHDEDGEYLAAKVYEDEYNERKGPGLSVSRALGDLTAVDVGLIPNPQLAYHKVNADDQYLILASDGVWTFLESDEVMQMAHLSFEKGKPAQEACKAIIARSARQWQRHEGTNYRDDITVIVVHLGKLVNFLQRERAVNSPEGQRPGQRDQWAADSPHLGPVTTAAAPLPLPAT